MWETDAPKYAGAFLELRPDRIIFGAAEGGTTVHNIKRIKKTRENHAILYTISHADPGAPEYTLSFYYDPVNQGTLIFKNQPGIEWTRADR